MQPLLVKVLALGEAGLIPWAMLALDLAALAIGIAALEWLLVAERINRWYAISYGLFGGVFVAVRVETSEPVAYGLVLCAILAAQGNRFGWQCWLRKRRFSSWRAI